MFIGNLNEDFAIESVAGDIVQLGNHSWRVLGISNGQVRVEDAGDLFLAVASGPSWAIERALVSRPVPPALRPYLGRGVPG